MAALGAALLVALVWTAPAQAGEGECGDTGDIEFQTDLGVADFLNDHCGITCRLGCRQYATACVGLMAGALSCENRLTLRSGGDERAHCFDNEDPKERSECILEATLDAIDDLITGSSFAEAIGFCTELLREACRSCESCRSPS